MRAASAALSLVMLFWTAKPSDRHRSMSSRDVTPNSRARSFILIPFLATAPFYSFLSRRLDRSRPHFRNRVTA